ncbi:hypothetical protein NQZ68_008084, partial [Dissostichus eleginoides]
CICCQSQSDRGEQLTKNGGAPWLPEPSVENNDKHSLCTNGSYGSKKQPENHSKRLDSR